MLGIGRTLVFQLIKQQKLETVKLGSRTLVFTNSIKSYVDELRASQSNLYWPLEENA